MSEQQIIPASAPMPHLAHAQIGVDSRLGSSLNFLRQPMVARALPAVALTGVIGLAAIAWLTLQSPTQAPLYSGLADADKAAVAEALQASGIDYSLDPASGALSVDAAQLHEAKMMLAGLGLPKAQPSGDAMVAALPMGASRAIEGETLRAAREADLARTIGAIDAIKTARVHLALAEPSVFVREQKPAAASVLLTLHQGRSLGEAQVRAIRHLVASSVPGLQAEQVSIIDQSGALLSGIAAGDSAMLELQNRIEARYREALVGLLTPVLGRPNFSVEVSAEVDTSESQATRESFPEDGRVLAREEGSTARGSVQTSGGMGIPGTLSNQPPPTTSLSPTMPAPSTVGAVPPQGMSEENFSRSFALGREISVTHQPQGQVKRLSVAVALRKAKGAKSLTVAEIAEIDSLVKGAIGFKAERGDQIAITARPFVDAVEPEVDLWNELWFEPLLRQAGAALAVMTILLLFGLPLRRKMKQRAVEAKERSALIESSLLEASENKAAMATESTSTDITLAMIESAPSYEARAQLVRAFVQQDPERAAHIVRHLMQERKHGG